MKPRRRSLRSRWRMRRRARAQNYLDRTSGSAWRVRAWGQTIGFRRARPVKFTNLDLFQQFLERLQRISGEDVPVTLHLPSGVTLGAPFDKAVDELRRAPDLTYMFIRATPPGGTKDDPRQWEIILNSTPKEAYPLVTGGRIRAGDDYHHLEGTIDTFATELTWWERRPWNQKGTRVVEPINASTASQREHDAALNRAAARRGAGWGTLFGALGGGIVQVLVEVLK